MNARQRRITPAWPARAPIHERDQFNILLQPPSGSHLCHSAGDERAFDRTHGVGFGAMIDVRIVGARVPSSHLVARTEKNASNAEVSGALSIETAQHCHATFHLARYLPQMI